MTNSVNIVMLQKIQNNTKQDIYSQTSEQRTLWDLYKLKCFVLCREVACPLLGGSKCIRTIGKLIIWDLEKRPLLRGLLYCVPISEGPLSEVLLYIISIDDVCILI